GHYFGKYETDEFKHSRGRTDEEICKRSKNKYKIHMKYYQDTLHTLLNKEVKCYLYFFKFGTLQLDFQKNKK
ncbi:hypothetical protein EIG89_13805, partial [Staphylococcus aureus]